MKKLYPYLYVSKIIILTDHAPLKDPMNKRTLGERFYRWTLFLSQFDYTIEHRSGVSNKVPDALSRYPFENDPNEGYYAEPDDWIMHVNQLKKDRKWRDWMFCQLKADMYSLGQNGDPCFQMRELNGSSEPTGEEFLGMALDKTEERKKELINSYDQATDDKLTEWLGDLDMADVRETRLEQRLDSKLLTMIVIKIEQKMAIDLKATVELGSDEEEKLYREADRYEHCRLFRS